MPHQESLPQTILFMDTSIRYLVGDGTLTAYMKCPRCGFTLAQSILQLFPQSSLDPSFPKEQAKESLVQLLTDSFGHLEHACRGE